MFDVFTEESEVLIKDGIANLYWYRADLYKAWLRSGVPQETANRIYDFRDAEGKKLTKRQQMDKLYDELRIGDYNRRLEISRNFVQLIIEQRSFTPQDEKHRIERAEHCSLKLRDIIRIQQEQREYRESIRTIDQGQQRKHMKSSYFAFEMISLLHWTQAAGKRLCT